MPHKIFRAAQVKIPLKENGERLQKFQLTKKKIMAIEVNSTRRKCLVLK